VSRTKRAEVLWALATRRDKVHYSGQLTAFCRASFRGRLGGPRSHLVHRAELSSHPGIQATRTRARVAPFCTRQNGDEGDGFFA